MPNEVGALGLKRVPSTAAMRRIASEPSLTPVWEPNEGEEGSDMWDFAQHSASVRVRSLSTEALAKAFNVEKNAPRDGEKAHTSSSRSSPMPAPWAGLLARLSALGENSTLSPVSFAELLSAAHESLRQQLKLHLCSGLLESAYLLRKSISTGGSWKIVEGVERATQRNFSLKIVSLREAPPRSATIICPSTPARPMQNYPAPLIRRVIGGTKCTPHPPTAPATPVC